MKELTDAERDLRIEGADEAEDHVIALINLGFGHLFPEEIQKAVSRRLSDEPHDDKIHHLQGLLIYWPDVEDSVD